MELTKRNQLESEQRSIAEYCNDLKRKFSNYDHTVIIKSNIIGRLLYEYN